MLTSIEIQNGDRTIRIGGGARAFVIAEIGKNFIQTKDERSTEEYLANAIALVRAAKDAGADAVKFQTHAVEDEQVDITVVSPHFVGADRYRWIRRNEAATPLETFWQPLKRACDELGILFFSTPMSRGAAERLSPVDPQLWKIGSGDLLDFVLLDYVRQSGKPILVSSGMSTLEEVDRAMAFLNEKTDQVVLLHCVSQYPCPTEDLNLNTIGFYRERYGSLVGFSDHSIGTESAIAAVALGAVVIEKHFSFDRALWGSDHKVSLTPQELAELVQGVARVHTDSAYRAAVLQGEVVKCGMGDHAKRMDDGEAIFRPLFRKTLVAAGDLPAGTILGPENVYAMRPQAHLDGFPSDAYPEVLGKVLQADIRKYTPLRPDHLV